MQVFLKILSGEVNSVDPDQTALIWVCTVCICCFIGNFGIQNFRIFTVNFMNRLNKTKSAIFVDLMRFLVPKNPFFQNVFVVFLHLYQEDPMYHNGTDHIFYKVTVIRTGINFSTC